MESYVNLDLLIVDRSQVLSLRSTLKLRSALALEIPTTNSMVTSRVTLGSISLTSFASDLYIEMNDVMDEVGFFSDCTTTLFNI